MSNSTWFNAPPLSAEKVLEDMRAAKAKIDALGPVPVEIATNPGERLDWGGLGVEVLQPVHQALDGALREMFGGLKGLRVATDPDVPPGEWWVKKSDGTHETHRGGLIPRAAP